MARTIALERQKVIAEFLYRFDDIEIIRINIDQFIQPNMHSGIVCLITIIQNRNTSKYIQTVFEFILSDQGIQVSTRHGFCHLSEKQ
jgi:ABC-type molybdate transport system substrate-binding protein